MYGFREWILSSVVSNNHLLVDISSSKDKVDKLNEFTSIVSNRICEVFKLTKSTTVEDLTNFFLSPPSRTKKKHLSHSYIKSSKTKSKPRPQTQHIESRGSRNFLELDHNEIVKEFSKTDPSQEIIIIDEPQSLPSSRHEKIVISSDNSLDDPTSVPSQVPMGIDMKNLKTRKKRRSISDANHILKGPKKVEKNVSDDSPKNNLQLPENKFLLAAKRRRSNRKNSFFLPSVVQKRSPYPMSLSKKNLLNTTNSAHSKSGTLSSLSNDSNDTRSSKKTSGHSHGGGSSGGGGGGGGSSKGKTGGVRRKMLQKRDIVILHELQNCSINIQSMLLSILMYKKLLLNDKIYLLNPQLVVVGTIGVALKKCNLHFNLKRLFNLHVTFNWNSFSSDLERINDEYVSRRTAEFFRINSAKQHQVYCDMTLRQYIRKIILSCRTHPAISTLPPIDSYEKLLNLSKVFAIIDEKQMKSKFKYVLPEHVITLIPMMLCLRITLKEKIAKSYLNITNNMQFLVYVLRNVSPPV